MYLRTTVAPSPNTVDPFFFGGGGGAAWAFWYIKFLGKLTRSELQDVHSVACIPQFSKYFKRMDPNGHYEISKSFQGNGP